MILHESERAVKRYFVLKKCAKSVVFDTTQKTLVFAWKPGFLWGYSDIHTGRQNRRVGHGFLVSKRGATGSDLRQDRIAGTGVKTAQDFKIQAVHVRGVRQCLADFGGGASLSYRAPATPRLAALGLSKCKGYAAFGHAALLGESGFLFARQGQFSAVIDLWVRHQTREGLAYLDQVKVRYRQPRLEPAKPAPRCHRCLTDGLPINAPVDDLVIGHRTLTVPTIQEREHVVRLFVVDRLLAQVA